MNKHGSVVVVGLGIVGSSLLQLLSEHYDAIGVDIAPNRDINHIDVMHICYPFQIEDFIGQSLQYIELYEPRLTIIDSTVPIGTTRVIALHSGASVAHSPVRGKHAHMLDDLRRYVKYVGALDRVTAEQATVHFESIGLATKVLSSPEATEFAKLSETAYFGLLIAWAQDVERACDKLVVDYDEIVSFYDEIKFFPPVRYFPGIIGGHCVMPNIDLLSRTIHSDLLDAISASNKKKVVREDGHPERHRKSRPRSAA